MTSAAVRAATQFFGTFNVVPCFSGAMGSCTFCPVIEPESVVTAMEERDTRHTAYLLFTLVLSVVGLAVIGASVALPMGPDTRRILDYADDVICGIFLRTSTQGA